MPQSPQKVRWPKLDDGTDFTRSAPLVQARCPAGELARPAMAPAAVEWRALEFVADRAAHAPAGQSQPRLPLIDYARGAPYIAGRSFPERRDKDFALLERAGF